MGQDSQYLDGGKYTQSKENTKIIGQTAED